MWQFLCGLIHVQKYDEAQQRFRKKNLPGKKNKNNERQEEGKIFGISMIYHQDFCMWSNEGFSFYFKCPLIGNMESQGKTK